MVALSPPSPRPMLKRRPGSPPKRAEASDSTWSSARLPQRMAWCSALAAASCLPEAWPARPANCISTELMPRCASTASLMVGSSTSTPS
ncbi:hypothetical protein G6F59_018589 [Rhizopus arrhizus]|nr:hypothetical protein G6F59_018589 [Rhizopus arrhizus]